MVKVVQFGGSSLASAEQFAKVCDIIPVSYTHLDVYKRQLRSYPFESMKPFIKMLNDAAEDPDVVSIKMTWYRVCLLYTSRARELVMILCACPSL